MAKLTSLIGNKAPKSVVTKKEKTEKKLTSNSPTQDEDLIIDRGHGFESLGTHCLRYISPELKELVAKQSGKDVKIQVAGFDLDDTLIKTKSGRRFSSPSDWMWWAECVPSRIREWVAAAGAGECRIVVVFTNQGSVVVPAVPAGGRSKSLDGFVGKAAAVLAELNGAGSGGGGLPLALYAATRTGAADTRAKRGSSPATVQAFRKPGGGMWRAMVRDIGALGALGALGTPSLEGSFFVGDAAGRAGDFSDSDAGFARAAGVQHMSPEQFFT